MARQGFMGSNDYTNPLPGGFRPTGNLRAAGRRLDKGLLFFAVANNYIAHDARGRWSSLGSDAAVVNARLAKELAEEVAAQLRSSITRPLVSTKRLEGALLDPKNRFSDNSGFGVGNIRFLNRSEAKYWRAIEVGTHYFVGKTFRGLWGMGNGPMGGSSVFGPYPLATGPFSRSKKGGNEGRFRPMSKESRPAGGGEPGGRGPLMVITKPIQAHHYFDRGWEAFNIDARSEVIIKDVFKGRPLPRKVSVATSRKRRP